MSLGYSVSDAALLVQLAWKTVQNSRRACGEHDELTREVSSLHVTIQSLEKEASKAESPINRSGDRCKEELQAIVDGCEKLLKVLNGVLEKYHTWRGEERSARGPLQRIRFGNSELVNARHLREKVTYYTSTLSLFLLTVSIGSIGRVEQQLEAAGGEIKELRSAMDYWIAAFLVSTNTDNDKPVDEEFRKEVMDKVFSSSIMRRELRERGLLDDKHPRNIERLAGNMKNLAGLAEIHPDHSATLFTGSQNVPKATLMAPLKRDDPGEGYRGPYDDSVDATTQGMAEGLDRGASPSKNDQDKYDFSRDSETNELSASSDRLQIIWQQGYFSIVLPQYEKPMSNPPSDRMSLLFEDAKLRSLILSRILIPLHAVNPRGNEGHARQIRDLFIRTDEMQHNIYEVENSVYAIYFNEEARRQRVENPRRQNDAIILTKRKDMMVALLEGDGRSDAEEKLVMSHNLDVPASASNAEWIKDAVPELPPRKAPSHSSAYQSPCPMCHQKSSVDTLSGEMLLRATT